MKLTRMGMAVPLLLLAAAARAQQPPSPAMPPAQPARAGDPLMGNLFPPELIMQNQQAIGLGDDQQRAIIGEIQRTQAAATGVQWRLQGAMERLANAVKPDHPDEAQVLAQLDSVLALEREMKRAQIALLVRIKDRLTPEQQAALRQRMGPKD